MASLKRDQSITILPADKGGATLVLDRDVYIQKAEQQLSDETTYKPLLCDPTSKRVTSISKTIHRLVREETISKPLAKQISPKETSIARAYGLRNITGNITHGNSTVNYHRQFDGLAKSLPHKLLPV